MSIRRPSPPTPEELAVTPTVPPGSMAPESAELRVREPLQTRFHGPDEKASGLHLRTVEVPTRWLDKLFVATCEMPVADGERAVVEAIVRVLAEIFPYRGVGVCYAPRGQAPELVRYVPAGEEGRAVGTSPTRLFPGFDAELMVPVGATDTTLHLGVHEDAAAQDGSPEHDLLRRAALGLERGMAVARSQTRARSAAQELRALNSHMVQAEKLASLGQLAAGIVHELNNPLTSIVAYTDLLLKKQIQVQGDPQDTERLRRIGESAGRMLRFTRDLITYARPSRETHVPVSLHAVVDQALAFCEHVLDESHARVDRSFVGETTFVRGMPEQLAQVFVNLVTNACHAMPESDGLLRVATRVEGPPAEPSLGLSGMGRVIVVVEDNGAGIATEHLPHVFTPFFTTKGEGKGTGLGLSIVKNILDNHGAEVEVFSRPGGGTRFVLTFPRVDG